MAEVRIELIGEIEALKAALKNGWRLTHVELENPDDGATCTLPTLQTQLHEVPSAEFPYTAPALRLTISQRGADAP